MKFDNVLAHLDVDDFDGALSWYEKFFGRPADRRPDGPMALRTQRNGNCPRAAAFRSTAKPDRRPPWFVGVDDVDDAVAEIAGARVIPARSTRNSPESFNLPSSKTRPEHHRSVLPAPALTASRDLRKASGSAFGETSKTAAGICELRDHLINSAGRLGALELSQQGVAGFPAALHHDLDPAVGEVARAADQAEFQRP